MPTRKTHEKTRGSATISPFVKARALQMYLFESKTLQQVADAVGVGKNTLMDWHRTEKWADQRRQLESDLQEDIALERLRFIRRNVKNVMERQLRVGGKLEEEIERRIDRNIDRKIPTTEEDLERLGKALATGASVSARVLGLDRKDAFNGSGPAGQRLLVNLNVQPIPIAAPEPRQITVEVSDVASEDSEEDPF